MLQRHETLAAPETSNTAVPVGTKSPSPRSAGIPSTNGHRQMAGGTPALPGKGPTL